MMKNSKSLENKNCSLWSHDNKTNNFIKWNLKKIIKNKITLTLTKMSKNKSLFPKYRSNRYSLMMMKKKIQMMK